MVPRLGQVATTVLFYGRLCPRCCAFVFRLQSGDANVANKALLSTGDVRLQVSSGQFPTPVFSPDVLFYPCHFCVQRRC